MNVDELEDVVFVHRRLVGRTCLHSGFGIQACAGARIVAYTRGLTHQFVPRIAHSSWSFSLALGIRGR